MSVERVQQTDPNEVTHFTTNTHVSDEALRCVILNIILDELKQSRSNVTNLLDLVKEHELDHNGHVEFSSLAMDSLERMAVSLRLTEFFDIRATGLEDMFLAVASTQDCVKLLRRARDIRDQSLTFRTSGSTGPSKKITHSIAFLAQEAHDWLEALPRPGRVVSMVPAHHLYGFVWSVMIPSYHDIPALDVALNGMHSEAAKHALNSLQPGDWLICTPYQLRYFAQINSEQFKGVTIISSSAPCDEETIEMVRGATFLRVIDIYGCSEYGGLALRKITNQTQFTLRPGVSFADATHIRFGHERDHHALLDHIDITAERDFKLLGRNDGAIQINGINVFPQKVERLLADLDGVKAIKILHKETHNNAITETKLIAHIVPEKGQCMDALEEILRTWSENTLRVEDRPSLYLFSTTLPGSAIV